MLKKQPDNISSGFFFLIESWKQISEWVKNWAKKQQQQWQQQQKKQKTIGITDVGWRNVTINLI